MTKISGNAISKSKFRDRRNFLKIKACIIYRVQVREVETEGIEVEVE